VRTGGRAWSEARVCIRVTGIIFVLS
jgi:hypothetical protein